MQTSMPVIEESLSRKEAIEFLEIPEKHFDNYFKFSKEIPSEKLPNGRWAFKKTDLIEWRKIKATRTFYLTMDEYVQCFEFAIKMAYSGGSRHGSGIRGTRSEVQMADDFILGILAEHGIKKFLLEKYNMEIGLDMEVHPAEITPQDIISVNTHEGLRPPNLDIAVKSSKIKSCFNILPGNEYEDPARKSDAYIFARVDLPSDHLFRILKTHSFFAKVANELEGDAISRKIDDLSEIGVWICGFNYHGEFDKVTEIPGQAFSNGYRYVKSVSKMHNSDEAWFRLISQL